MEEDKYPAWLAEKLLNFSLDWTKCTKTSMSELLSCITLHDSYWYTTSLQDANSWVLIISLDAIWNKKFCHNLENWPFLLIRFQNVLCAFQDFTEDDGYYRTIGNAETAVLEMSKMADWISLTRKVGFFTVDSYVNAQAVASLNRTEISTIYGGALSLVHAPGVDILLYTEEGSLLPINLIPYQ